MAPRRTKKNRSDWQLCNNCNIIVYYKDVTIHTESCLYSQPNSSSLNLSLEPPLFSAEELTKLHHNFIFNGALHGEVAVAKSDDLEYLPKSRSDVFLHPSTMKLCKMISGSYVIISGLGETSLHVAWPRSTIKHTSVVFSDKKVKHKPMDKIVLCRYSRKMCEAGEIIISPSSREDFVYGDAFKQSIHNQIWDLYVCQGMTIKCNYHGVQCEIAIKHVSCVPNIETRSDNISQMICDISNLSILDSCLEKDKSIDCCNKSFNDQNNMENSKTTILCSTPRSDNSRYFDLSNRGHFNSFLSVESMVIPNHSVEEEYFHVNTSTKVILEETKEVEPEPDNIIFESVGGLKVQKNEIKIFLNLFLSPEKRANEENTVPGILFTGPSGTGKSFVSEAIKNEYDAHFITITGPEICYNCLHGEEHILKSKFQEARERAPSIIFLDEMDLLCKLSTKLNKGVLNTVISLLDELDNSGVKCVIIATTNDPNEIDAALSSRFCKEVKFSIPSSDDRTEILTKIMKNQRHNLSEEEIFDLANRAHGCTGFDLHQIYSKAKQSAFLKCMNDGINNEENILKNYVIKYSDMQQFLKQKIPDAMKDKTVEVQKVHYSDIGGMYDIKEKLKQAIEWPLKYPQLHQRFDASPTHGVLLHGPPGCSKTMIVKALATESNINFIPIRGSELLSKWFGESEKAVRDLFKNARAAAPCIIFFDEIDALVDKRGSNGSDVGSRVVTQLLTEIDGVEISEGVIIVAATNRPDMIDDAMMRQGRFDHLIYVPLPDAESRTEIFQLKLNIMPISSDVNIKPLVEKTDGYSGAEIIAVCHEAAYLALTADWPRVIEDPIITMSHLEEALTIVLPRTSKETIEICKRFSSRHK